MKENGRRVRSSGGRKTGTQAELRLLLSLEVSLLLVSIPVVYNVADVDDVDEKCGVAGVKWKPKGYI